VVGWVDGDAAELTEHDGRLFVSTWPVFTDLFEEDYDYAGIWMSPRIGRHGLRACDADRWKKVWSADEYEQDEVAARLYNGGAMASFDGYLYWGTIHAPLSAGFAHVQVYDLLRPDDPDVAGFVKALIGGHRPISIFRGRDFGTPCELKEVLYGLETMPAYVKENSSSGEERVWKILPNKMGPPRYGPAGLGNGFNTYTWTMAVQNNHLFIGTMDWSHMLTAVMLPVVLRDVVNPLPEFELPGTAHGSDLFMFESGEAPALEIDRAGVGNYGSHGIRTMLADGDFLYLGMANAMNLMTDKTDPRPEGGWELIRLSRAECPHLTVPGDFTGDGRVGPRDRIRFLQCFSGSCKEPPCHVALYEDAGCSVGDFDKDGDIDLKDWAEFNRQ
jgi:hypothetical protein